MPDSSSEIPLTIGYNVNNTYDNKAIYTFSGGYHSKVVITNVTVNYGTLSAFQDALVLNNVILVNREYPLDCVQNAVDTVNFNTGEVSTKGELKVYWNHEHPADEYDLEWAYIDSAALSNYYKAGSSTVFDPKLIFTNNATRVSIAKELYYIPLLYDSKGHLFFRVRTVQVKPNGQRIESSWSSDFSMGLGRYDFNGHERMLNWQATTTFAEEGKRKSVVQYFDGSLRGRQTVTKDNTTDTTIVAESFYDFQGRPVIQVLPVPSLSSIIKFTPKFNTANGGLEYDKENYDGAWSDSCYCLLGAPAMDTTNGAAKYYSGVNPNKGIGYNKYIPNALGYPFTETRYTADNTGRIAIQSGVGLAFQIGKKMLPIIPMKQNIFMEVLIRKSWMPCLEQKWAMPLITSKIWCGMLMGNIVSVM
ncbi:MAG: hypothetical protein IPP79_05025 [Chitinophagaceae bacterium]|nr:hypothetical protein [Chitinophagaceae bacterium]